METKLNQFLYMYNYTSWEATSDHKSLAKMFFDHRFRIHLDIFTSTERSKSTLSHQQIKMKKFDIYIKDLPFHFGR